MPRAMLLAAVAGLVVTAALTPLLAAWARRRNFLDIPNHRSSHLVATPRIGGVAIVFGVLAGLLAWHLMDGGPDRRMLAVVTGAFGIALLGLVDDFRHLPALVRLVVQTLIAAGVVIASGHADGREGWLVSSTVLWLVTLVNAYNFMDGIDGIAGAQAVVAGTGWTAVAIIAGTPQIAPIGLLLAAASAGFLWFNWHPARVFMGDGGSGFIGFLFAALPLLAPQPNGPALWICAVLLMWPFLADTGFTLLRRASRGENVLSAHRSHLYQRFVLTGRSHRDVTLVYAGLALLGAIAAISFASGHGTGGGMSLALIVAAAGCLWWKVTLLERVPANQK